MFKVAHHTKVYFAIGPVDMRRQIDGLALRVQEVLALNPFAPQVFVFCNAKRDRVKGLYWDDNGFVLFYKRIERGRFHWPRAEEAVVTYTLRELSWLLDGHCLKTLVARNALPVSRV